MAQGVIVNPLLWTFARKAQQYPVRANSISAGYLPSQTLYVSQILKNQDFD
jgi:hypothetical protein